MGLPGCGKTAQNPLTMRMNRQQLGASYAGVAVWLALACVVLGAAFYLIQKNRASKVPAPVIVVATPPPATPIPATPTPVVVKATPTPVPVVMATPPPATPAPATPPPLDLATVARTPALWPPQVLLIEAKSLPVSFNGRVVGEAKVPVGTALRLLRVGGQQVEVEYQNQRHLLPAAATDLMPRALAAFRQAGSVLPQAPPTMAAAAPEVAPAATPRATGGGVKIGERIAVEVVRQKRSRIEGGDFDDKKDRIALKVKLSNTDTAMSGENLKGEICVLGESILDRNAVKMLAKQEFTFSLPPRGAHELLTDEVETAYDTTGARFGHRYEGWVLRVRDSAGNVIMEKSNSPSLIKIAAKISEVAVNGEFDRSTGVAKKSLR